MIKSSETQLDIQDIIVEVANIIYEASNCKVKLLDDNRSVERNDLTLRCTRARGANELEIDITPTSRLDSVCFMHVIDEVCFPQQSFSMLTKDKTIPTGFLTNSNHKYTEKDPGHKE